MPDNWLWMREGRDWAANFGSEMRGDHLKCDGASAVSGPGHGHDYVQITLGQSPSPHPLDPAHAEQGPEKYTCLWYWYLIYDLIIPRSLVEHGIKSDWKMMNNGMRYYICSGDRLAPQCHGYEAPPRLERVVISEAGAGEGGRGQKGLQTMTNLPDMCQNYPLAWQLLVFVSDEIPE